ncbi:helitron_like_N domain-containing protein [Trichonephila clavipes]|nr:helitron_like_N domain-containing protein [Trichonephila clavipes]
MTSFGSSKQIIETEFMPILKVQGQVYHRIGSIFPCPAEESKFLQIYFMGNNMEQDEQRCKIVQQVKQEQSSFSGEHSRFFNEPTTSEVAVIAARDQHGKRYFILKTRISSVQKVAEMHRSYDALQYSLIFWQVEDGYHFQLRQRDPSAGAFTERKVIAIDF